MIELYQGTYKSNNIASVLSTISLAQIEDKYQLISPSVEPNTFVLNFHKYKFYAIYSGLFLDLETCNQILKKMNLEFPKIIWTKVCKFKNSKYILEFHPISEKKINSIQDMGYEISKFKQRLEEIIEKVYDSNLSIIHDNEKFSSDSSINILQRLNSLKNQIQIEQKINEEKDELEPKSEEIKNTENQGIISTLENIKDSNKKYQRQLKKKKRKARKVILSIVTMLILFSIGFIVLGNYYSVAKITGNSMSPTMKDHSVVIFSKNLKSIERNNIISFKVPELANKSFVKRVVALEGDTIYAHNGKLYINGNEVEEKYLKQATPDFELKSISGRETVPKNKVFVLGDNRTHSTDSRNFGFVDISQIKGVSL